MYRLPLAAAVALVVATFLTGATQAVDMVWDGGDGDWTDANWNTGKAPEEVVLRTNGTRGFEADENSSDTITIGSGATVQYDWQATGDMQVYNGNTLTVTDGASLELFTPSDALQNFWTEMDATALILDNGTFKRTGAVTNPLAPADERGGGALIFGSWKVDDNNGKGYPIPNGPPYVNNIFITNGGRLENEGQMWIASWEDVSKAGYISTITIDDGTMDLSGGEVSWGGQAPTGDHPSPTEFRGDLVLSFPFIPGDPNDSRDWVGVNPEIAINFTGPGSIITSGPGPVVITREEDPNFVGDPNDPNSVFYASEGPQTYQQLWDAGILQANGLSGLDEASFGDYFTVTNDVGDPNYTLTSLLTDLVKGDVNGDGKVDHLDIPAFQDVLLNGAYNWAADVNDDNLVNGLDRDPFVALLQGGAAAGQVPEPSTLALMLVALVGLAWSVRRRC